MKQRRGRRSLVAVTAAVAMASAIAACGDDTTATPAAGTTSGPPKPVTITFESYNYGTPDLGGEGTQELIDEFERLYPHITVKPAGSTPGEILAKVQAQAAAGNPPDVAQIGISKIAVAVENLPVVPVSEINPDDFAAATEGFAPQALAVGEIDGQVTVMPYTLSTPTLFYNATLFEQAGLDPEDPPANWAEVKEAALAIAALDGDAQGVYSSAANAAKSDFLTQSLINSNGGSLLSPDGDILLDSPEAVEALAMLGDLTSSGAQPAIPDSDATNLFKAGKLGMYLTSTAVTASLKKAAAGAFELRTASMPAFGSKPTKPTVSGAALVVMSEDTDRQQAAWEFVEFLTSEQGMTIVTEKIGYLPLRPNIVDDPDFLGPFLDENPEILPALEQLGNITPYQSMSGPRADQARQILQDEAVAPIMLDGADPAETARTVDERITDLIG